MTSKTHAIAVMMTFLISVTQASAQSAIATGQSRFDVALVDTPAVEVSARSHYRQAYDRYARHRYYHPTLPYDGYRPYALPIYQCTYYGPFPLWPYCYGW